MIKKEDIGSYFFSLRGKDTFSLKRFEKEEKVIFKYIQTFKKEDKIEKVFKLEYLLKGVRDYFHLGNHPKKTKDKWNFIEEERSLIYVFKKIRALYNELFGTNEEKNFINFVESKFKISLEYLLESELEKEKWKAEQWIDYFMIKLEEIEMLSEIFSRSRTLSYREFMILGDIYLQELVKNPYIYPFVRRNFKIELHRVIHKKIKEIILSIDDIETRYVLGINIIESFKTLRIIQEISVEKNPSLDYFILVHIRGNLERFKNYKGIKGNQEILSIIEETISKVYNIILANIFSKKKKEILFEKSKNILTEMQKKIIILLLKEVEPGLDNLSIFPELSNKKKFLKELYNSLDRLSDLIEKSLNKNIEEFKSSLLQEMRDFENNYLLYLKLKYWEKFYRLFFSIKHSPHKYQLLNRIRDFSNLIETIKKDPLSL